jgi:hypothetical protein
MTRLLVGLVLVFSASCSFVYVHRFEEPAPGARPTCTSSYTLPLVDAIVTAIAAGTVIYAVATHDSSSPSSDVGGPPKALAAGFGSLVGVGFGVSALVGVARVGNCREEKSRF